MIAQRIDHRYPNERISLYDNPGYYSKDQDLYHTWSSNWDKGKEIVVYKAAVFVQGDFANQATKSLFYRQGYEIVDDIELADIVVWTGGADINPKIYGEVPAGACYWNDLRDQSDLRAIEKADKAFKIGICRGAQLLNCVPNGGRLWQDVDKHSSFDHSVVDLVTKQVYVVNSLHHQQMIPTDNAEIIATTRLSTEKRAQGKKWEHGKDSDDPDVEVCYYPDTKSLCFQAHPEFSRPGEHTHDYFFQLIDRYYHAA